VRDKKMIESEQVLKKTGEIHFSENYEYIIDSEGNRVDFDDPRIVFVEPAARNPYGKRLVIDLYKQYNRTIRVTQETDENILQYAKQVCSGRECVPSLAIAGAILKDIKEYRADNEITIYRDPLNQHGPCQNGAWPVLWDILFKKRLMVKDAFFCIAPSFSNNFLGLRPDIIVSENVNFIIGHYLVEARNALQCVAENKDSALERFEVITDEFINNVKEKKKTLRTGLVKWAREVSKIPLKTTVETTPKVLIFGGLNLLFNHYSVEEYFLEKGIIVKVVDLVESLNLLISEPVLRYGLRKGIINPKQQFEEASLDISIVKEEYKRDAVKAKRGLMRLEFLNSQCNTYKKIMSKSGLLFDPHVDYADLIEGGNKYVTSNSFTETPVITGRFVHSINSGVYDGLINMGAFNCQPAMNSQAIIRPIANKSEIPYAAIDCEGPWIASNQMRLLETIAVQAKRLRKKKNKLMTDI
jgi:predicted nucleotide-binding protein (sugar kinase/HSP70/actin superfamily)